jgi:1-acyl-sn-glycerol-3-phosphate acyltransferase
MVFRVLKIVLNMLGHMIGFAFAGLRGKAASQAYLQRAYLSWGRYVLRVFDVELHVHGQEHIPQGIQRPLVVLSNHQSQLDIPSLGVGLGQVTGFVAKQELGRIPILAYWMKTIGCVLIDRNNKAEAQRTLSEVAKTPRSQPLIVFPEGTRSKSGELLPFKLGGARLALMAQALVLPALIERTRDAFEARGKNQGPFQVHVTFFPVLDAAELGGERSGLERIKNHVESAWRKNVPVG